MVVEVATDFLPTVAPLIWAASTRVAATLTHGQGLDVKVIEGRAIDAARSHHHCNLGGVNEPQHEATWDLIEAFFKIGQTHLSWFLNVSIVFTLSSFAIVQRFYKLCIAYMSFMRR